MTTGEAPARQGDAPLRRRSPVGSRAAAAASVVIPAHDEARVIEGNLRTLMSDVEPGALDVVVACNGCSDDTAAVAARVPGVRVVEIPEASKRLAVQAGSRATAVFPRVHLDADVAITGSDVLALVRPLRDGDVLATAPRRELTLGRSSWPVRAYYRVWEQLPQVRDGLFGRGVVALSEDGQRRVDAVPPMMSDDLGISEAFGPTERRIVADATVVVRPPRTTADLLRRRIRVVTGNAQAADLGVRRAESATGVSTLVRMSVRDPRTGLRVPVFLAVGLLARWRSRRAVRAGDFTTWLRDESSRA